jgi:hypothetical protein
MIEILYITLLIVILIVLIGMGVLNLHTQINNKPLLNGGDIPNSQVSDYNTLLKKYQNYGQAMQVDNDPFGPMGVTGTAGDFMKYEYGLGDLENGFLVPKFIRTTPAACADGCIDGYPGTPVNQGDCYLADSIIARRVTNVCTGPSGCYPNYKYGESYSFYTTDETNYPACALRSDTFGLISIGESGNSACLVLNSDKITVGATACMITDENQLWSVARFSLDGSPSDSGLVGQIQSRQFFDTSPASITAANAGKLVGGTGCLIANPPGTTGSTLVLGNCGLNWAFNPQFSVGYPTPGAPGSTSYSNVVRQITWVGGDIKNDPRIGTDINAFIKDQYSISRNGTLQKFMIPTSADTDQSAQQAIYNDYRLYNLITQFPGRYSAT